MSSSRVTAIEPEEEPKDSIHQTASIMSSSRVTAKEPEEEPRDSIHQTASIMSSSRVTAIEPEEEAKDSIHQTASIMSSIIGFRVLMPLKDKMEEDKEIKKLLQPLKNKGCTVSKQPLTNRGCTVSKEVLFLSQDEAATSAA